MYPTSSHIHLTYLHDESIKDRKATAHEKEQIRKKYKRFIPPAHSYNN